MFRKRLKTQLSLTIAMVVAITVFLISLLADRLVNYRFQAYMEVQQEERTQEIVSNLSRQFDASTQSWNMEFIHTIGMYFLYDGFIIQVYDHKDQKIWDAQVHDMSLCNEVMSDIVLRMKDRYPKLNGEITSVTYDLTQENQKIGQVSILYYGPFFLNENDVNFINAFHTILLSVGSFSLLVSVLVGWLIAKRISKPITNAIHITQEISRGNYDLRVQEQTKVIELDELVTAIHHLEDTLKSQEGLRKQLTADVAHELRTPLATVATYLEAMMEGVWEASPDRLQSCYEEIQRIVNIVKDLENLTRVESQVLKLNKTKVDLSSLVTAVSHGLELEVKKKNISLEIHGKPCFAQVDEDRIKQVIFNLLSNSLKYTKEYGSIKVLVQKEGEANVISVKDNGVGIPLEEQDLIFERFYRADKSRNRKTGGAGIGLAIVKSIIKAHEGSIELVSQVNQGSEFIIRLP